MRLLRWKNKLCYANIEHHKTLNFFLVYWVSDSCYNFSAFIEHSMICWRFNHQWKKNEKFKCLIFMLNTKSKPKCFLSIHFKNSLGKRVKIYSRQKKCFNEEVFSVFNDALLRSNWISMAKAYVLIFGFRFPSAKKQAGKEDYMRWLKIEHFRRTLNVLKWKHKKDHFYVSLTNIGSLKVYPQMSTDWGIA